jgi:hypothetical protein
MTAPGPSWLSVFDDDDRASFFAEMREALETSAARKDPEPFEACLRAWKVTAEAMADPEARAVLTSPHEYEDFAEVSRPGAPHN